MTKIAPPRILLVGLEPMIEKLIADLLANTEVMTTPMELNALMVDLNPPPCLVIGGPPSHSIPTKEAAQVLRMQYPHIPLFFCCMARQGFERKTFILNGFTDAFLMPMDTAPLRVAVSEALALATNGAIRIFRPVKIIDLEPKRTLDFETSAFLPANRKYLRISAPGESIEEERLEKLKKGKMNSVYVPVQQMDKFYEYSAKKLRELSDSKTISLTERREKLAVAVRDLISNLFTQETSSFESGQAVLRDFAEIVKTYIMQGAESEWYLRIIQVLGERGDAYTHASNVSTLAALFSMGLGVGKPEDLALAGLLHDIGIAELPPDVQGADHDHLTPEQFEKYKKHPEMSVALIRSRKIVVPEAVAKAILQHHEYYNGAGYPNGLFGDRLSKEAQVLSLADKFEYLTRLKEGHPLVTPGEAVEMLRKEQTDDPSQVHYQPELLRKLLALFPDP